MSIFDFQSPVFWLLLSGLIFFIMTVVFLAGPFRRERSELMYGILGFLGGMAWFHLLLGAGMYFENPLLGTLAAFGAMTGSAFLLKFPLTSFTSQAVRKNIFYAAVAIAWLLTIFLLVFPKYAGMAMLIGSIYMVVVSGGIAGSYLVWKGITFRHPAQRIKCIGGGCSIMLCCLVTHIIVLTIGMTLLAKLFMLLTPITAVLAVILGHAFERKANAPATSANA